MPKKQPCKKKKIGHSLFLDILYEKRKAEKETSNPKETREGLRQEYEELLERTNKKKAYKVTFKNVSDIFWISFQQGTYDHNRYKSMWEAVKYFQDNFHPVFLSENMLYQAVVHRAEELDEYYKEGKVPILMLMEKLGATFSCKACGKGKFDLEDYEMRRCYITEEFDLYPFTKGIVLCKDCFRKYVGED